MKNTHPSWLTNLENYPANGIGDLDDLKVNVVHTKLNNWTTGVTEGWYYLDGSEEYFYRDEGLYSPGIVASGVTKFEGSYGFNSLFGPPQVSKSQHNTIILIDYSLSMTYSLANYPASGSLADPSCQYYAKQIVYEYINWVNSNNPFIKLGLITFDRPGVDDGYRIVSPLGTNFTQLLEDLENSETGALGQTWMYDGLRLAFDHAEEETTFGESVDFILITDGNYTTESFPEEGLAAYVQSALSTHPTWRLRVVHFKDPNGYIDSNVNWHQSEMEELGNATGRNYLRFSNP